MNFEDEQELQEAWEGVLSLGHTVGLICSSHRSLTLHLQDIFSCPTMMTSNVIFWTFTWCQATNRLAKLVHLVAVLPSGGGYDRIAP